MKHLDYKSMKVLLVLLIIFLLIAIIPTMRLLPHLYLLLDAGVFGLTSLLLIWAPFVTMLIFCSIVMKKIHKYEEWLSVVVKENYLDSVCAKYKIK
ncbi:MAG: hypothetical protein IJ593_05640, partial [Lachnospiraceae bacterium]|nr:hypothetical protein [Lachnospiraceae bacterium]